MCGSYLFSRSVEFPRPTVGTSSATQGISLMTRTIRTSTSLFVEPLDVSAPRPSTPLSPSRPMRRSPNGLQRSCQNTNRHGDSTAQIHWRNQDHMLDENRSSVLFLPHCLIT